MDFYKFDDNYVTRLREGDRWTEEHFVRYFNELLLIKLRHRLRTKHAIDDVRQEVFVRVYRNIRSGAIRDGRRLGSFVNSVGNNVLHEWYRHSTKTEPLETKGVEFPDDTNIEEIFATAENRDIVHRILREMPEKEAKLLRAVFIDERDKDEICRELGVDRNYLRVLLHRALERFRRVYTRMLQSPPDETNPSKPPLPC